MESTNTTNTTLRRCIYAPATVRVRSSEDGKAESRTIEGYAILFNTPSAIMWEDEKKTLREQIAPEAVTQELLDSSDIKMTMNHDFSCLLARSKMGKGTLSYAIDAKGVRFSFEAPQTDDGDRALELVRRGDIDGCSFMFTCSYRDPDVTSEASTDKETGRRDVIYTIHTITGIYDFTLTPMPAYPDTEVSARELRELTSHAGADLNAAPSDAQLREQEAQLQEMRREAAREL